MSVKQRKEEGEKKEKKQSETNIGIYKSLHQRECILSTLGIDTAHSNKQCKQHGYQKKMQVANHNRPIHLNHQKCRPGDCQHYGRAKCAGLRRPTFPNVFVAFPQQRPCYPPHARLCGRLDPHCARPSPFDRIRRARSPTWPRTSPAGQELPLKPMSHMA